MMLTCLHDCECLCVYLCPVAISIDIHQSPVKEGSVWNEVLAFGTLLNTVDNNKMTCVNTGKVNKQLSPLKLCPQSHLKHF